MRNAPEFAPPSIPRRFGRFELRPSERVFVAEGTPVAIGARAFDLLVAFVDRPGTLITKDELLAIVWPGLVVEVNNLQVQVSTLRKILGQSAAAIDSIWPYRAPTRTRYGGNVRSFGK